MTSPTDPDLVRACLAGDAGAWARLVQRYADLVYGIARAAGRDDASAQDVVQDVNVALWKGLRRLQNAERLLPWVVTTARREAWRSGRRRRAGRRREEAVARPERDQAATSPDALAALEEEQVVREALGALGERCRRLLQALYFEAVGAQGYDAVAERLGMPRGSLGPTRARCLDGLRRELASRGLGPDVSGGPPGASLPRRRRTP